RSSSPRLSPTLLPPALRLLRPLPPRRNRFRPLPASPAAFPAGAPPPPYSSSHSPFAPPEGRPLPPTPPYSTDALAGIDFFPFRRRRNPLHRFILR
ncbi:Os07g0591800, partial [Oryza sativa Japonica Group]